jgi:hypothetical protein
MYLEEIKNKLPGQKVKIKYDCNGGNKNCGKENNPILKVAQINFEKNNGKHICRSCTLKTNNPMKNKENVEKIKKTNIEKYGVSNAMNTKEAIEKRNEKMFGTKEAIDARNQKTKETNIKKYGADHIMKTKEGKNKVKTKMQEKYGVDHPYQSEDIMQKMKSNNMKKYGVENVASLPETQIKMAKTTLEKYGVEHYNQLPEMKDYLRENCKEWLKESYANPWAKGITRPEEWNQKQRETVAELMMLGMWKSGYPRSHKGFCFPKNKCKKKKVYFRSSYEAIYCFYLDYHPDVEWFSFEAFRVPYEFDGKQRYYIPDFLIKWKDTNKLSIKELKAEFMREDEQVEAKTRCAQLFATNNNMDFEMLCCKDIHDLKISFDELKENGFVHTEE